MRKKYRRTGHGGWQITTILYRCGGAGAKIPFQAGKVRLIWGWRKDGCRTQEANHMPLYMDRHNMEGATREGVLPRGRPQQGRASISAGCDRASCTQIPTVCQLERVAMIMTAHYGCILRKRRTGDTLGSSRERASAGPGDEDGTIPTPLRQTRLADVTLPLWP
jgi:hypothetical protein